MIEFKGNISEMSVGVPIIAKNSEQFSIGDAVYIDTDGFLALATTSSKILGYALEDKTATADNQTVAKYCPQYVYADNVEVLIDSDQAATQTDIGAYADLGTVTTGVMVLNLAAGATGQFLVLGWDTETPNTSKVIATVAEPQRLAFSQA
jgi:hypothetical protein